LLSAVALSAALVLAAMVGTSVLRSNNSRSTKQISLEEVAKLEPELCKPGSSAFRGVTAALPTLVGSLTQSMTPEQIAFIDQYKASGRRKVWVLRMPAAFITSRTCDSGRQNWQGEGEDLSVAQHYQMRLVALPDRLLPLTHANDDEKKTGVQITVDFHNKVRDPDFRHRVYEKYSYVVGQIDVRGGPRCHDVPSEIAGLVQFKRIDPNIQHPIDCEGNYARGVYASKIDHLVYDFIVTCQENCRAQRDFHGWGVEYSYHYTKLGEWRQLHERLGQFLTEHTIYMDEDRGNP
jgi:hypothetical protein